MPDLDAICRHFALHCSLTELQVGALCAEIRRLRAEVDQLRVENEKMKETTCK